MADTSRLELPLVEPAQAQKHVTVNEALSRLDGLVQLVLQSVTTTLPPALANGGDCYGVPLGAVNDWAGQEGKIAIYSGGGWTFAPAQIGFRGYIVDQSAHASFDGADWAAGAAAASANGAATIQEVIEIDHVIGAGATSVVVAALPANAVVYGATGRVLSGITGTLTSFRIGVSGSDNRYGSGLGLSQGSWLRGLTGTPLTYYSPEDLILTGEGGDFAGGTLRIAVHLLRLTLPNE